MKHTELFFRPIDKTVPTECLMSNLISLKLLQFVKLRSPNEWTCEIEDLILWFCLFCLLRWLVWSQCAHVNVRKLRHQRSFASFRRRRNFSTVDWTPPLVCCPRVRVRNLKRIPFCTSPIPFAGRNHAICSFSVVKIDLLDCYVLREVHSSRPVFNVLSCL